MRLSIIRWLSLSLGIVILAVGCLASLLLLYGGGSWQSAARLEATNLSTLEVNELIGSTTYAKEDQTAQHSLLTAFTKILRVPFSDPKGILSAQLPVAAPPESASSGTQGSLLQSLTQWEQHSNKLALGWIPYDTPARTINMIQQNPGITVISPAWLSVASADGSLQVRAQSQVVDYTHQHHIKVWAMLDNQFHAVLTHNVLSQESSRNRLVQNVVKSVKDYHLDGINVDFENIHGEDEPYFTAFMKELHDALSPLGTTLSCDITPDIVFLKDDAAYFHAGLAKYSDYVILMAYDEHWSGDSTAGPVADVPWVTQSLDDLLSTGVPADKLVLGLPFYARFWYVHKDGHLTSQAIAAATLDQVLASHNAVGTWNSTLGVAYAKYNKPDGYMEVWYETDKTMELKLGLVNDLGLPGVAIWSLSLSNQQTWSTMIQALRQSVS